MKVFLKVLLAFIGLFLLLGAYIQFAPPKNFNHIAYPEVHVSMDSANLARGEYLVNGPAHCSGCHRMKQDSAEVVPGEKMPMAGGNHFDTPLGKLFIPNITPDPETGIGNLTDGEIARALRYAVSRDGRALIPAMPFTHISEEDMGAIISYLRAQDPVKNVVPKTNFTFFGKALQKFMLKPFKETKPIPKSVDPGPTLAYGAYLTNNLANCEGCHTTFNMFKMEFDGVPFSGGTELEGYRTPNLTPDPKTGHIVNWTEEQFVSRFRAGPVYLDSPMPWESFSKMPEEDLRAMYKYLQTIEACENPVGPIKILN
jgi:mono/diheme cytochrome c family protein